MPEPPNSSRNLFWVSRLERPQITPPFLPPPPECIHFNSPGAADLISNVSTRRRWAQPGKRFGLRCCHGSGAGARGVGAPAWSREAAILGRGGRSRLQRWWWLSQGPAGSTRPGFPIPRGDEGCWSKAWQSPFRSQTKLPRRVRQ